MIDCGDDPQYVSAVGGSDNDFERRVRASEAAARGAPRRRGEVATLSVAGVILAVGGVLVLTDHSWGQLLATAAVLINLSLLVRRSWRGGGAARG